MPNFIRWCVLVSLLTATSTAAAQVTSMSLDATVGTGGGQTNGIYLERRKQALSADVAFGAGLHQKLESGLMLMATASYHSAGSSDDLCMPGANGTCMKTFPSFTMVGTLIGWESARSVFRVATGLAYAKSEHSTGSLAVQARIDAAKPIFPHLALVASLRGTHVPDVVGDRFSFFALGVGVRVY